MKPIAFILLLFAGLPGGLWAQSEKAAPVDFKGHLIGEGVADFLRIEPEAQQEVDVCRQHPARHSCDRLLAALKAEGRAEISTTNAFNFVLDGGKLVKLTMLVDKPLDQAIADLTQKFGRETKAATLPAQNGAGAKWSNTLCVWDTPSVYLSLYFDNNPALDDHRLLLIAESHAEHVLEDISAAKQPTSLATTASPAATQNN
jgi:hypothetical protein